MKIEIGQRCYKVTAGMFFSLNIAIFQDLTIQSLSDPSEALDNKSIIPATLTNGDFVMPAILLAISVLPTPVGPTIRTFYRSSWGSMDMKGHIYIMT